MRGMQTGITGRLARALVIPALLLGAFAVYLIGANALAVNTATQQADRTPEVRSPWKASYSRQFPGCVAAVLWPARETPVAVVVKWQSGEVERIKTRYASNGIGSATTANHAAIIGACYRR